MAVAGYTAILDACVLYPGFCRNKGMKLGGYGGYATGLKSQAIELFGSGRDFAYGAV